MTATGIPLALPGAPAIDGLVFRTWRGLDDIPGMAAANQRVRDDAGVEELINVESMTRTYTHLVNCDLDRDLVIVERNGRTIGYVRVEWRDLTSGGRQFFSFCVLDPAERGQGIGQAMLAWSEARLAQIAAEIRNDRPAELFAYSQASDAHARSLLQKNGWTAVAHGYEMVRPTLDAIPSVDMPHGIVVRDVSEAERRMVWEAARVAFRDSRDEHEWTEEDWVRFAGDVPDPSLWIIAFDGEAVAGGVLNMIDRSGDRGARAWLATVWTGARWRRRGLAKALIARSLARLRDHGMSSAFLGVDGANPNQAMDLYASLGFEIASTTIDWRKPLRTPERVLAEEQE
ncbi:MAG TPA: GNAT family N-acetyltransferase [Candidatus Limnocylindrales bacterium]